MDLIGSLVSQLGVDRDRAEGAAGAVFKTIQDSAPAAESEQLVQKVPEASGWLAKAQSLAGGGGAGGLGGALGGLGGALGGLGGAAGGLGGLTSILGKLGIGGDKVGLIVPLVVQFLQSRLGGDGAGRLLSSVPFLKQLGGGGDGGGGPLGGLGKLLG